MQQKKGTGTNVGTLFHYTLCFSTQLRHLTSWQHMVEKVPITANVVTDSSYSLIPTSDGCIWGCLLPQTRLSHTDTHKWQFHPLTPTSGNVQLYISDTPVTLIIPYHTAEVIQIGINGCSPIQVILWKDWNILLKQYLKNDKKTGGWGGGGSGEKG